MLADPHTHALNRFPTLTMDLRALLIYLSMLALGGVGLWYGWRFLQLRNQLLGYEWFVLGGNSLNGLLFTTGLAPWLGSVWHFLDVFSQIAGVTVIGALGSMRVTHGLHLSGRGEAAVFAAGLMAAWAFLVVDVLQPALPWVAFGMGLGFLALLVYIARVAFASGLRGHGWAMLLVVVLNLGIGVLQDSAELPGDATALFFNRRLLEHLVWALSFGALFHVYVALGRDGPARRRSAGAMQAPEAAR